ncbi:MAG: zf-TFIIB domain-containing protein [Acidiferrobacterales bacterium]|nr:zf-TFIIB domain-containing protein [Acidiferrobacterales bacterium]
MECPKCHNRMNELQDTSFSAAKCTSCNGIWFRDGSHEVAKKLTTAKKIDETNTHSASTYNLVRDFDCPECDSTMIKMVDPTQMNIDLESCSSCFGVYFDAGEFKDFSEFTLLERVNRAIDTFKTNLKS